MKSIIFHYFILAAAFCTVINMSPAFAATFDKIEMVSATPLTSFQKVYVAPVKVKLDEINIRRNIRDISNDRPVSEQDQILRAQDLQDRLIRAFGKRFEIVEAPGEHVLTVEATITKLASSRPTLADFESEPSLNFASVYAGGADFSVRLTQGEITLINIQDSYATNFNDGRPRIGTWQDYDIVSRQFARKLMKYASQG